MSHPYFTEEGKKHIQKAGGVHDATEAITHADTSSDMQVRKRIEKKQGPTTTTGGQPSIYRQRTSDLADKTIKDGALSTSHPSKSQIDSYSNMRKSEGTDEDLDELDAPKKARKALQKAKSDSASAMNRLKKGTSKST